MISEAVIIALISGGLAFLGTCLTVWAGMKKQQKDADVRQAVTDEKLTELTREVRRHNDFAEKIPVIQNDIVTLYTRVEKLESDKK